MLMAIDQWIWQLAETIPSRTSEGKRILDGVLRQLEAENWFPHEIFGVHLAMEEALVNAIKHGNRFDDAKQVQVVCKLSPEKFYLQVSDEGTGFRVEEVPDCTEDDNLEKSSGRGIMLMRNFMSRVEYNASGNCVTMEKLRGTKAR
jgi:serine/threonine-protein kinase RsbW